MQNHRISGGRTHQKDVISFRFLDIGYAPFSSIKRGKISENSDKASYAGYETEARDIKNQKKHLQCISFTAVTISPRKFIKLRILS